MSQRCRIDELRTLFLFEHLTDEQLEMLCTDGRVEAYPPGPLYAEGEPAELFYVLLDGELVMSGRAGGVDVLTNRTSQRGVYCGAWSAYVPGAEPQYQVSVRLTRPSRFFVLEAGAFARFMQTQFPMAVHLLGGHTLGGLRQRQLLSQQEKLLALGTITAGLTHQLNNPAAAITGAISDLRTGTGAMREELATVVRDGMTAEGLLALITLQDEVVEQIPKSKSQPRSALHRSDREDALCEWLDDHGIDDSWQLSPTLAEAGLDTDWLDGVAELVTSATGHAGTLRAALGWLTHTVNAELRMYDVADAAGRISTLVAGAKQYSQMDRGAYQSADVHDLLRSTMVMFGDKIGDGKPVSWVCDWDPALPQILCYPGDLNQVWTNIIDNALEAMDGRGTVTLRTAREGDDIVRIEIRDDGCGIADEHVDHVFTPFFTTKPSGKGSGLGLDIAWRIIVDKHRGNLYVQSGPGDTRFVVLLPLTAPAPPLPMPSAPEDTADPMGDGTQRSPR
ncbi:MAG: histidine kinase [Actinobacteria bacterium]|nr:histidine kinase [Actinomycetota bacterium]